MVGKKNKGTKVKKIKSVLFIFAHPDDEAYGPAGTITKLSKTKKVFVVSLCRGNRPESGIDGVSDIRKEAFMESNKLMGSTAIILDGDDTKLNYNKTVKIVSTLIANYKPETVYTHNISDLHKDHRIVAEACMVACRPKPGSSVKELYMSESPAATDWAFSKIKPVFEANTYMDVSDLMDIKSSVMKLYETEIYAYPDARSIESMRVLGKYRGKQVGLRYAEAFTQVFRLC
jgi:LmbE family N-acetylglucosaminyl deacetylase